MSDVVGNITGGSASNVGSARVSSTTTSSAQAAQAEAVSFASALAATTSTSSSSTSTTSSSADASSVAVLTRLDPVAGPMTQYTDGAGDVVWQVPSALAVSYLRVGLTADGLSHRGESTSIDA